MPSSSLLVNRRFLPYFITQFCGAFNDNVFKNVLLLLVAFTSQDMLPISSNLFINIAAGLFILPYFLFSASAGILADHYEKSQFIRWVKLSEILIMALGAVAFITHSFGTLLGVLFLMGTQSAFFGPVKYALLPQHLTKPEIVPGNALVETGTFLAIFLGTIGAGMIAPLPSAEWIAAGCVVFIALLGYLSSRWIPDAPANHSHYVFQWQPITHTKQTLQVVKRDPLLKRTILTISWFWFLGAAYLTQFPNFTRQYLLGNETAVSFLLALFSVGIALGSLAYDKLSHHRVELGSVPISAALISLWGYLFATQIPSQLPVLYEFSDFVIYRPLWPTFAYLFLLGISGGLFIVPLYALLQQRSRVNERAQVIAALNIYNALFMVGSAILGIVTLSVIGLSIPQLFAILAIINALITLWLLYQYPVHVVRLAIWLLCRLLYRVRTQNVANIPESGGALIVCNHVSYMDALLLSAASPRLIRFVMEEDYANFPIIRHFLRRAGVIPINAARSQSIRQAFQAVEQALDEGELVCIFPEGRLTSDGEIHSFMRGTDIILQRSTAPVIPVAIRGLWGTYFSRHLGRACKGIPKRWWSKVDVVVGTPIAAGQANNTILREQVRQLRGSKR